ncbi:TetR/AcrR family transcriptional regulator [Chryseobacterium sp. PBS4-4]|uniref:TetR/AcrR family transcriptional regulator n=1 Tax=Chryseobacterium edaphi TaxID=2976532 RepID=A0ABT2W1X7_9FLAO|nr:TetR/AcrR family transcriptional regulator [Chryseobacterium edaphi]MCU7616237.1 TetR/AcrR family transcriptional regulator [Chryseobacterium edaphi]
MKDTKDKIIAATVFCLNMNENASIDEIANHLGINRRTIHRYFKDRNNLLQCCLSKMMSKCNRAMADAYESSADPIEQVEAMFDAALSIGIEYSFVKKIFKRSNYGQVLKSESLDYESVNQKWCRLITGLQHSGVINNLLPISWVYNLFGGIVDIAIQAETSGDVAINEIRNLSWDSFKGSIGMINK